MRILKFYFNINIQKKRGQETYYLTMNGFIVVVVFLVKNQFSHKKVRENTQFYLETARFDRRQGR